METKFGKFITTKTFAVLFIAILAAAMGYMGVRIGNAVEWLCGARLYIPIVALLALMILMLAYTQNARAEKRYLRVTPSAHRRGAQDNRSREHWNAYVRGEKMRMTQKVWGTPQAWRTACPPERYVKASLQRKANQSASSTRSILKMTGRVPSEQQAIMVFSWFIHPFMMEPPCRPV